MDRSFSTTVIAVQAAANNNSQLIRQYLSFGASTLLCVAINFCQTDSLMAQTTNIDPGVFHPGTSPQNSYYEYKDGCRLYTYDRIWICPSPDEKAKRIQDIAKRAAIDNKKDCSGSVQQVAKELGIPFTTGNANTQIEWMRKNWQPLTMAQAKERADRGELVIAGRKDSPNGHTTIVVKGSGVSREGAVWPNIAGGAMSSAWAQGKTPSAYSEGNKTIRNAWGSATRGSVEYYTPK